MILIWNLALRCIRPLDFSLLEISLIFLLFILFMFLFKKINKTIPKWNSGLVLLMIGGAQTGFWIPLKALLPSVSQCPCRLCQVIPPVLQQQSSKGTFRTRLASQPILEYVQDALIGISPKELLVHTHFYWEMYYLWVCFTNLHAQPCICSVSVTFFALSAGSFSYFFLWEHAVIAPVFQRACNPKSVRRKYFFKEENVFFVNFLNLSSIQLRGECKSKLLLGLGWDFSWFHLFKQELTRGMSKIESPCEVPSQKQSFRSYKSDNWFITILNESLLALPREQHLLSCHISLEWFCMPQEDTQGEESLQFLRHQSLVGVSRWLNSDLLLVNLVPSDLFNSKLASLLQRLALPKHTLIWSHTIPQTGNGRMRCGTFSLCFKLCRY